MTRSRFEVISPIVRTWSSGGVLRAEIVSGEPSPFADDPVPPSIVFVSDSWTHIVLASNFTTTNGTTSPDPSPLLFTPTASKAYWIKGMLGIKTATDFRAAHPGLTWPTGLADSGMVMEGTNQSQTGAKMPAVGWGPTDGSGNDPKYLRTLSGLPDTTNTWFARMEGILIAGASVSGSLTVTMCCEVAGVQVTLLAGSWIAYQELPYTVP